MHIPCKLEPASAGNNGETGEDREGFEGREGLSTKNTSNYVMSTTMVDAGRHGTPYTGANYIRGISNACPTGYFYFLIKTPLGASYIEARVRMCRSTDKLTGYGVALRILIS